jgi:HD-GYP domain-containing protein (c-di-GMP phosphodiesterase class II)
MANGWGIAAAADEILRSTYLGQTAASGVALDPARRIDLLAHFSGAFDLGESQPVGHAARVAHLAFRIGRELHLPAATGRRVLNVALLHDAGVSVRTFSGHLEAGAWVAERFGLDEGVGAAIRATHERWDGNGRPGGLVGDAIPVEALVVSAAHWANDHIEEPANPLRARANLQRALPGDLEEIVGPRVTGALCSVLRDDRTWIAMWAPDLLAVVAAQGAGEGRPSHRKVEQAAEAMGEVIDAAVREPGRARRVAGLASALAHGLGLPADHARALSVAGHVLDIGQLGVPRHITEKPSILSVDEMEQMRRHPGLGARMLEAAPGLAPLAGWIEAHHERPDGRGYPGMLTDNELDLPPRILAVADAYCALRADRPYRSALSRIEALALVRAGSGTQFDASVVGALPAAVEQCEARWRRDGIAPGSDQAAVTTPRRARRSA